jgi:hypothetical protein
MQQVSLNDQLYLQARERAQLAGFSSVDDYVADVLTDDLRLDSENLDSFFTPERLALVDEAAADVARGNVHTLPQVREALAGTRDAWLRNHPTEK